jgi:hypothetical protein
MEEIFNRIYPIFADFIGQGMFIMLPDNDFLFNEKYDFSYIDEVHRDKKTGLVGKYEKPPEDKGYNKYDYPCAKGNR